MSASSHCKWWHFLIVFCLFVCFSCLSYFFRHLQSHGTGHTFFKTMCWLQLDIIWAICFQVKWIGSSLKIMGLIANLEILFCLTYFSVLFCCYNKIHTEKFHKKAKTYCDLPFKEQTTMTRNESLRHQLTLHQHPGESSEYSCSVNFLLFIQSRIPTLGTRNPQRGFVSS